MKNKPTSSALGEPIATLLNSKATPSYRILVVDDDRAIRQLSTQVLVGSGYEVDAAEDGALAWLALRAKSYDLLITDNNMPNLSGFELLKMRSDSMTLPVIMASGTLPPAELSVHPSLRLSATLLKPFTSEELLGTVKKILNTPADGGASPPPHPIALRL